MSSGHLRIASRSAHLLEFQFTANSFIAPERLQFSYRLDGYDEQWINAGTRRAAYYTNLRPGSYAFRVTASQPHQKWNEATAVLLLFIKPAIHQTGWFRASCGVLLLWAGYSLIRWRLNEIHKINRLEQEAALSHQRKQIARDLHDELGASLTQIAHLSEETQDTPAPVMSSGSKARKIAALAEEAVNRMSEIVWANNAKYDTLADTTGYLREYAANYLSSAGLAARLEFPESVPARVVPGEFRRHLLLVIKEGLHNTFKHAEATSVSLQLCLRGDQLELCLADNGRGFSNGLHSRSGNGLGNMQQRIAELGGSFEIQSHTENGTEIKIRVTLPPG